MVDWIQFWPVVGLPLLRGVLGWARTSFDDGKILLLEWQQLGETVLRIGVPATVAFLGLVGLGVDVDVLTLTSIAVFVDVVFPRFVALFTKKKK
jgi:hypothetical protein